MARAHSRAASAGDFHRRVGAAAICDDDLGRADRERRVDRGTDPFRLISEGMITLTRIGGGQRLGVNCYVLIGGHSRRMGASKMELFLPRIAALTIYGM